MCIVDYPEPMTDEQFWAVIDLADSMWRVAISLGYVWGQRISDIIQLATADFTWESFGQLVKEVGMQLAAGRTLPALPPVTLPTIPALLAKWAARPQSVVDRHKAAWNKDKRRFLLLLSFSQTDRELILTSMKEGANRTYTKETWFSAVCAAARDIDVPVTREMAAYSAVLRFMALQEAPSRPTAPLTPTDATQLSKMLTERNLQGLATAVGIAFLLGQRMGDVMNLGTNALCVVHDLASNVWMIALTFRETKTSRVTQPYSLHILRDSPEGQQLMNLQQEQLRKKATHLFGDPLTRLDDYKRIVDVMRLIDKDYSILSIRRGGLQLMSLMGLSTAFWHIHDIDGEKH